MNQSWKALFRIFTALPRAERFFWIVILGMALVMAIATPGLFAQNATPTGFSFEGSRVINQVSLTTVTYAGECPGSSDPEVRAWFSSSTTPPRHGLRVFIQNVTQGVDPADMPYTNREYDEGLVSEDTIIEFGTDHSSRRFHVLNGENTFNYEIRDDDTVIESGTFTAIFNHNQQAQTRNATCQTQQNVCANPSVSWNVCADLRSRTQCSCPNGQVLRTSFNPSGPVRTLISNQTHSGLSYQMGGRLYHLASGEDRWYEGNNLGSITFDSGNGMNQTRTLTPGTRYQFTQSFGGGLQLSEWWR